MENKYILIWMHKIFKHGVSYFNRIKLFSSIPLHSVMHDILLIYVKFNYKYSEGYKSNVAPLKFTILSDGNSSDI
jgi:hypothetical protein